VKLHLHYTRLPRAREARLVKLKELRHYMYIVLTVLTVLGIFFLHGYYPRPWLIPGAAAIVMFTGLLALIFHHVERRQDRRVAALPWRRRPPATGARPA